MNYTCKDCKHFDRGFCSFMDKNVCSEGLKCCYFCRIITQKQSKELQT